MAPRSLLRSLADELAVVLDPVALAVESPEAMSQLLERLGVYDDGATGPAAAFAGLLDLKTKIETLAAQDDLNLAAAQTALEAAASAFSLADAITGAGSGAGARPDLGRDLVDLLLETWLVARHPLAREVLALLTLLEVGQDRPQGSPTMPDGIARRVPIYLARLRLDRLPTLLRDPVATLKGHYVINALATQADAAAMADRLLPQVAQVLRALGVSCRYGFKPGDESLLGDAAPLVKHALIVYAVDPLRGVAEPDAGVVVALSPASHGDLGLVVSPFGALTLRKAFDRWIFESTLSGQIDVLAWGRHGTTLLAQAPDAQVKMDLAARTLPQGTAPAYVLGAAQGTRLELGSMELAAGTSASSARQSLTLSVDMQSAALVIAPADGDGFLASILPAEGIRANLDLGLAWSSEKGLALRGSADLEATLPIGLSFAGVSLTSVHVGLRANDGWIDAEVSASVSASIGPVRAALDRVGIAAALSFPERGGNLGAAHLEIGFKPPSGIGLSVEAEGVLTGGGFLFHDAALQLYAGTMQLSLHETITLKAVGLIATQMPDGSRGYSLIIFITAEDFQPIPLGLGFTLQGIGGMVAVHRTFDEDVLRAGLKNGSLSTLLFPQDPVTNAAAIVRSLASAFPARRGSYLLGLLARIGWFTPTLVRMDLALILEFGVRKRLLVLGRISALLPSADNDLVRLVLDAMGVIDFDQGTASIDAVLVDSRLVHRFALTGAMALRARWTSGPGAGFVLAVGGLNPHFTPPVGLPQLERIGIALSSGKNPRLTCESYFAITSNTLQFGARAQAYAAAYGFSVEGDVGYDVLIERAPFHFIADFHASVQLKHGSSNLFKVALEGALEGPRPLRLSGRASFEILWCDFTVRFDKTLVDGEKPPLPPAIDVLAELERALSTPQSWSTRKVEHSAHGVALRKLSAGHALVIDPLGQLVVKQLVVPLNTGQDIDTFGGAPVTVARRFQLFGTLNGQALSQMDVVREQFAPAQFFRMTDDEKLVSPSFQEMEAGLVFGSPALSFDGGQVVSITLDYESIVIDAFEQPSLPAERYALQAEQLQLHSATGAAARAPVRKVGLARFRNLRADSAAPVLSLQAPRWEILPLGEGAPVAVAANVKTWNEYRSALAALNRGGTRWQLVPVHELAA